VELNPGWEKFALWRAKEGLGGLMPILRLIGGVKTLMHNMPCTILPEFMGGFQRPVEKLTKGPLDAC